MVKQLLSAWMVAAIAGLSAAACGDDGQLSEGASGSTQRDRCAEACDKLAECRPGEACVLTGPCTGTAFTVAKCINEATCDNIDACLQTGDAGIQCGNGIAVCDQACPEGHCTSCVSSGTCAASCSGSGCAMTCAGSATCEFSCLGGGCLMSCLDGASCSMSCEGGGCSFTCATVGPCSTTCTGGGCSGSVDGPQPE